VREFIRILLELRAIEAQPTRRFRDGFQRDHWPDPIGWDVTSRRPMSITDFTIAMPEKVWTVGSALIVIPAPPATACPIASQKTLLLNNDFISSSS
jgi:hypothetical protein